MKKRWVALIALAFLIVGIAGTSWFWLYFYGQFMNHSYLTKTEADIVTRVAVLEHIRSGRTAEATSLMETLLDGDLIGAAALAGRGSKFSPNTSRAVALEIKARAISGYVPADENVRGAVQDAFRLIAASSAETAAQPIIPPDLSRQAAPSR
jgi:hypothetical protein